jgi:uncharacterized SAM-binding protein YcdF (DUF218 family)
MRFLKKRWRWVFAGLAFVVLVLFIFHAFILNALAQTLVRDDALRPCDAIVVLTGDYTGERLEEGIDLLKKGYGKHIVFWGGPIYWKITYAELYLRQLKENGVGTEQAVWSEERLDEVSSDGESVVNMKLLRSSGAHSFILVTSGYHTARAGRVYKKLARQNGMEIFVHPSKDSRVKMREWWKDRDSAKVIFMEFQKTAWYLIKPARDR